MEAYAAAKETLFAMPGLGAAVINLDDAFGVALAHRLRGRLPVLGYTLGTGAAGTDEVLRAENLRQAHERNDEVLERIYIGRRFKNDTERLEKLFELYTKMAATAAPAKGKKRKAGASA